MSALPLRRAGRPRLALYAPPAAPAAPPLDRAPATDEPGPRHALAPADETATERDPADDEESSANVMIAGTITPAASTSPGKRLAPPGDDELVRETRRQVRQLADEISRLAQSDMSTGEFHAAFLARVVTALAAEGGVVWLRDADGAWRAASAARSSLAGIPADAPEHARHEHLLDLVARGGEPTLTPPGWRGGPVEDASGDQGPSPRQADAGAQAKPPVAANPTDHWLMWGVLRVDGETRGLVELFKKPGAGPASQRGQLRFLAEMCGLASGHLRESQARALRRREAFLTSLADFAANVHRDLRPRETLYTLAHEGCRLIGAERVSVALRHGRRYRVEVVSGLDALDRRASQIKLLEKLVARVAQRGRPFWHGEGDAELPPQLESALQAYLDSSRAKTVAIWPLRPPAANDEAATTGKTTTGKAATSKAAGAPLGVLIVEQFHNGAVSDDYNARVAAVARHGGLATHNALEHSHIFLGPLWRALGKSSAVSWARSLSKLALVLLLLTAAAAALGLVPMDFDVACEGKLRPTTRREVYAGVDGVLAEVYAQHGRAVQAGDVLARLRNTTLEMEITAHVGKQRTTQEQIRQLQRALHNGRMHPDEQNRVAGRLAELSQTAQSLALELAVLREKERQLAIVSPVSGEVATWQARDLLLHRPVRVGQRLLTIIDPAGAWELELDVPDKRMGHVRAAAAGREKPLEATFILATHPETRLTGRVLELAPAAEVLEDGENVVRARVAVERGQLPDARDGAQVTARLRCGRRSLGYVLFHDVIETAWAKVLFWF